jgi:hypothetical protein
MKWKPGMSGFNVCFQMQMQLVPLYSVGTIGSGDDAMRAGNGSNNVRAIEAAAAAGARRFVHVSVVGGMSS